MIDKDLRVENEGGLSETHLQSSRFLSTYTRVIEALDLYWFQVPKLPRKPEENLK